MFEESCFKFKSIQHPLHHTLIDFFDQYLYAKEEMDTKFPSPGDELDLNMFFDSAHGHNRKTGHSISGLVVYVGNTPIIWHSRRQGAVQSSSYGAELYAMHLAVEELLTIRYML
jgi:hypothetical protein